MDPATIAAVTVSSSLWAGTAIRRWRANRRGRELPVAYIDSRRSRAL